MEMSCCITSQWRDVGLQNVGTYSFSPWETLAPHCVPQDSAGEVGMRERDSAGADLATGEFQ